MVNKKFIRNTNNTEIYRNSLNFFFCWICPNPTTTGTLFSSKIAASAFFGAFQQTSVLKSCWLKKSVLISRLKSFQIKCRRPTIVRSFFWTKKYWWSAKAWMTKTITTSQNASTSRGPKKVTRSVNSILWVVVFLLNIYYNYLLLIIFILCYFNTKFVLNELFSCMLNKFRILIFSSLVLDSLHQLEPDLGRMAVRWSHLQNDRRDFWQARHGPPESKKLVLHSTSMIHFKWDFCNDIVICGFNKFKTITINK